MNYLKTIVFVLYALLFAVTAQAVQRNLAVTKSDGQSQKRVALVIGNAAYQGAPPLRNPVNDAKAMSTALNGLGFEVIEVTDATQKEMNRAITSFGSKLNGETAALFFYAGHGLQVKGRNYIVPVDAQIESEAAIATESVSVDGVLDQLNSSPISIVILDACRNNPFERSFRKIGGGGLAQMDAPKGSFIAYATAPGKTAADGDGKNGLFTQELLKQLNTPGVELGMMMRRVRASVSAKSGDAQMPWDSSSMTGEFYFKPGDGTQVASLVPVAVPTQQLAHIKTRDEIEQEGWESVQGSGNIASVQEYLKQYPKGRFAGQAKILISNLKGGGVRPVEPVTPVVVNPGRSDGESDLWAEVQKGNSRDDYDAYLAQYPKGKFVALARSRIAKLQEAAAAEAGRREQEAWESAEGSSSEDAYRSYLKGWPSGKYTGLAQVRIRKLQADRARAEAEMKPGKVFKDCPDCPELVILPAGSYTMGSGKGGDESPAHNVTIRQPFAMGRTEITRGQFSVFANETGYNAGDKCWTYESDKWEERSGRNWRNPGFSQDDSHPVACINWSDAKAYSEWISRKTGKSYQLPSESQWEYACRAGGQNEYCGSDNVDSVAWYGALANPVGNSAKMTNRVATKQVNGFGLYDMSGNVWEWTADSYHDSYNGAPNDGSEWSGDGAKRVLRGGSWVSFPRLSRAANRGINAPALRCGYDGFRVSRTLP